MTETQLKNCLEKSIDTPIYKNLKAKCEDGKFYSIEFVDQMGVVNEFFDSAKYLKHIKTMFKKKKPLRKKK